MPMLMRNITPNYNYNNNNNNNNSNNNNNINNTNNWLYSNSNNYDTSKIIEIIMMKIISHIIRPMKSC